MKQSLFFSALLLCALGSTACNSEGGNTPAEGADTTEMTTVETATFTVSGMT